MQKKQLELFPQDFSPRVEKLEQRMFALHSPGREFRAEFVFRGALRTLSSLNDRFALRIIAVGVNILGEHKADLILTQFSSG